MLPIWKEQVFIVHFVIFVLAALLSAGPGMPWGHRTVAAPLKPAVSEKVSAPHTVAPPPAASMDGGLGGEPSVTCCH